MYDNLNARSQYFSHSDTVKEEVVYRQTHFRIGQWLVGISLGYIMYQMKDEPSEYRVRKVSSKLSLTAFSFSLDELDI